jgi:ABC-type branched-subunit amino acid transport system ATPase component
MQGLDPHLRYRYTKGMSPHRRAVLSVAHSAQDQPIFQDLTVEENLRLGLHSDRVYASAFDRKMLIIARAPVAPASNAH